MVCSISSALHRSHRDTLLICLFAFFSVGLFAQNLSFKNFSGDDILPSSNIYAAFQDREGMMWFASDRGVIRYDGYTFTSYTTNDGLSDNEVFDFFEDSSGRIWFQTMNGKVSYYVNGEIINAAKDTTLIPLNSESNISGMFQDAEGNIWIATLWNGVVCALKNGKVQRFLQRDNLGYITSISPLGRKGILLTRGRGIGKYEANAHNDSIVLSGRHIINELLRDPYLKTRWVSANDMLFKVGYSLYRYSVKDESLKRCYESNDELNHINSISRTDDQIWVCTSNGVMPYSWKTGEMKQPVLTGRRITSVFKDREGNYWITTLGDGIFFSTSLGMSGYTTKDGLLTDKLTCLTLDRHNRVWIGYEKGAISYIEKGKISTIRLSGRQPSEGGVVHRIHISGNRLWVAASFAFFLLENNRIKAAYWGGAARDIIEYPQGHLWLGGGYNILRFPRKVFDFNAMDAGTTDFKNLKHRISLEEHRKNKYLKSTEKERAKAFFLDSRHTIWIATEKNLYRSSEDSLVSLQNIHSVTGNINDFAAFRDNTLLAASAGNGIFFIRGDSVISELGEEQGLSSGICSAVATDHHGVIWVATHKGLNKISGYPDSTSIEYFTIDDGLYSNEISDVLVAGDTVWAATKKGLNLFHRNHIQKKIAPPEMYIDAIMLQGVPVQSRQQQPLVFQHSQNDIGIRFTGVSYNNGGNSIVYRYKLSPETPWRYTRSTSVYLPELPSGDYQFTISCKGKAGGWSKEAIMSFSILKPFWQTYAFIGTTALILAGTGWTIIAAYLNGKKKKIQWQHRVTISELRTLRAQMNPHFLFNALNSIQGVLLKHNVEAAQEYLSRFGKLMRLILDHSDKTTVMISEELESITNYLEIEQLRSAHQFAYAIEIAPEIDIYNTEIPAMIVQPFIENAIHHGLMHKKENGRLQIQFTSNGHAGIDISIRDNGIGRKMAMQFKKQSHRSKGIQLVKERIDILNFKNSRKIELDIRDLEDVQHVACGTLVTIKIPFT